MKANPQRIVFAEGEEERTIRAAVVFRDNGYGTPILIGREEQVRETMKSLGIGDATGLEIHNARLSTRNKPYTDLVYKRLQRDGYLRRDVQRMVNQGRNVFGACMVAMGDAAGMVTGITRRFPECYSDIQRVIDAQPRQGADGLFHRRGAPRHGVPGRHLDQRDAFARAARHHRQADGRPTPAPWATSRGSPSSPSPTSAAARSIASTASARRSACSTRRRSTSSMTARCRPTWRSTTSCLRETYPFCRLTGPANVLVMPGLHSAHISSRLMQRLGGVTVIGPVIDGLQKPMQIVQMGSTVSDLVNHAALAAYGALNGRRQ